MARSAAQRDEPECGPAMQALNEKQRLFVTQYVLCGNAARATKLAGYGSATTDDQGYARLAWQLKQRPTVALAIEEEGRRYLRVLGPAAVSRLAKILTDPKSKDADALRAVDIVLARVDPIVSGQVVQVNHDHRHRIQLSADQITARIMELAGKVGVALPPPVDVVDVVAEEVVP